MYREKKLLLITGVLSIGFLFSLLLPRLLPSAPQLFACYHAQVGSSNALLEISEQSGEKTSGTIIFQNYEKDSSYGKFTGTFKDKKLTASYTFQSEGVESTREITFEQSNNLLNAEGFAFKPIKNCKTVLYNQGLGLIPFDIKLPLHLFSQLRLQSISEAELTTTFGPGGFKPTQSAKLVYTPLIGEPTNVGVFYLWQKSVWDVIANPNEASDWGVMQWSDQSNVFSVNGPQDCIYPNKPDCDNVTEISKQFYDKNAFVNKVPKYEPAKVTVVKTRTIHDPETGYYVVSEFKIEGIKAEQTYRCDLTAFDKAGNKLINWQTEGRSFAPNLAGTYSGQTNITP
ncbi:MAG: hypothetical protein ACO294_12945, partial [Methylococcales bacterium]